MWEGGKRVPQPPRAKKKSGHVSVTKTRRVEVSALPRRVRWKFASLFMRHCSSSPLCGAPPRPPAFNCTLCHSATRPSTTLPLQEAVLASAGPSLATPPAPGLQSIHSGLRQVRFLRKLMPGEGFCMHVLCYLLKTLERYAVPAAIATCCPGSIRALLASRLFSHVVLCSSLCRAYSSGVLHLPHGPY